MDEKLEFSIQDLGVLARHISANVSGISSGAIFQIGIEWLHAVTDDNTTVGELRRMEAGFREGFQRG